ncbi:MAG: trk system potassium uptake protein TrkA [Natronomonas sp.]|jgi:trk system potassium uptake protein TrkA|uniref:potassium channel family protein n=1 Tax=Natronomonas sp. TaxID=2184060 RepID=UPI003988A8D6
MGDLRIIIVGAGRVGFHTAEHLSDGGHTVVVIEQDERRCQQLSEAYFATVIEGDGARPDVLEQANPADADIIAGLTPNPGTNLAACVLAERRNEDIRTVIRVNTSNSVEEYAEVVDETVFPERAGAHVATNAIVGAEMQSIEAPPGALNIVEVEVAEDAPIDGRKLSEISLPRGSLVIGDATGDEIASSDTTLVADNRYLVAVEPSVVDEVRNLFRG